MSTNGIFMETAKTAGENQATIPFEVRNNSPVSKDSAFPRSLLEPDISNTILLDREAVQENCSLIGLDKLVAEKLGYRGDNIAAYDVCYLRISRQIYEMVFREYKKCWKQHIESGASLDSMDRCGWGFHLQAPQVDETLKSFEVRVLPGFIVKRTE